MQEERNEDIFILYIYIFIQIRHSRLASVSILPLTLCSAIIRQISDITESDTSSQVCNTRFRRSALLITSDVLNFSLQH